jgi:hypothetical protein
LIGENILINTSYWAFTTLGISSLFTIWRVKKFVFSVLCDYLQAIKLLSLFWRLIGDLEPKSYLANRSSDFFLKLKILFLSFIVCTPWILPYIPFSSLLYFLNVIIFFGITIVFPPLELFSWVWVESCLSKSGSSLDDDSSL